MNLVCVVQKIVHDVSQNDDTPHHTLNPMTMRKIILMDTITLAHFEAYQRMMKMAKEKSPMTVDEFRTKHRLNPEFATDLEEALLNAYQEGYGRGRQDTINAVREGIKKSETKVPQATEMPWERIKRPPVTITESSL